MTPEDTIVELPMADGEAIVARLRGPGPYIARSASDKREDWPFWYVAGPDGRTNVLRSAFSIGVQFTHRVIAEEIAAAANAQNAPTADCLLPAAELP